MKYLSLLAGALAISISTTSSAAIISYGSYSHDDTTDIVIGDGLEWLQWDRTIGMTWNDAVAQLNTIEGGGWSIATNAQMASLFNNFGFGITFDADENTSQSASTGIQDGGLTSDPSESDVTFVTMFGQTFFPNSVGVPVTGYVGTHALYGTDLDNDGLVNLAEVYDDHVHAADAPLDYPGLARMDLDAYAKDNPMFYVGVALVRNHDTVAVPEPTALSLLGLGMVALGFSRSRKKAV